MRKVRTLIFDPHGQLVVVRAHGGVELPGGVVRPGESDRSAALRFVESQTGLVLESIHVRLTDRELRDGCREICFVVWPANVPRTLAAGAELIPATDAMQHGDIASAIAQLVGACGLRASA